MAHSSVTDVIERRAKILRLKRQKFSIEAILEACKDKYGNPMSRRTYYNDMKAIREDSFQWQYRLYRDGIADNLRLSIESLEERQRQLAVIASNTDKDKNGWPVVSARDRIEAHKAIADIEMMIANLTGYAATTPMIKQPDTKEDAMQ